MKKVKVVNKFRFYTFILIITAMIFSITFIFINKSLGANNIENSYIDYTVKAGDTVWSIAEKYQNNKIEIRDFVDLIIDENKIDNSMVSQGEIVKIPVI